MHVLKERFLYTLVGAVLCAAAAIIFVCTAAWYIAILCAAGAAVLTVCTFRSSEKYRAAKLITENPILNIGVASVAEAGAGERAASSVDVVVSGFGILMDGKPYQFGQGCIELTEAKIDRESIAFAFGGEGKQYSVRLLHGVAKKSEVDKFTERLRYETGVVAEVRGW